MSPETNSEVVEQYRQFESDLQAETAQIISMFNLSIEVVVKKTKNEKKTRNKARQYALSSTDSAFFSAPSPGDFESPMIWNEIMGLCNKLQQDVNARALELAKKWPDVATTHRSNIEKMVRKMIRSELQKLYKGATVEKITGTLHWLGERRPRWL